jgi:hypothetical protein
LQQKSSLHFGEIVAGWPKRLRPGQLAPLSGQFSEHEVASASPGLAGRDSAPARYREAIRCFAMLEAHGLKPLRRTLGSRFRSTRRRR